MTVAWVKFPGRIQCARLVADALDGGRSDNVTVVVARMQG